MLSKLSLFSAFLLCICGVQSFRVQGVAAKGRLKCNGRPLVEASVSIYDKDRFPFDSDELLDQELTDEIGAFFLDGTTRELTNIEPELRIVHNCTNGGEPHCRRYLVVPIDSYFIHSGDAEVVFDFGVQDLSINGGEMRCRSIPK
ncbi:unnamed protein product [Bursaphelenchus okinawaensis]|uniref:Uncharacterized protein n=1 Tax=Bursaphelenchus okinawaensis TaxID=465554 RepID=A0A811KZN2_9BILA|nr:unnamed protein product [Bursaphelenchus okinawaensis]CAG9114295.1 unnamed protein product [Bursaphelenchus okinawaensis]